MMKMSNLVLGTVRVEPVVGWKETCAKVPGRSGATARCEDGAVDDS
jgi:hypothetical protein